MVRNCLAGALIAFVVVLPRVVLAESTPEVLGLQVLVQQFQEQIRILQDQILSLQAQLNATKEEVAEVKAELKFTRSLQRGDSSDEVKQLQEFLKSFPDIYPEGLVTGYFGPLTETAVKKLQEREGIEAVGIVGPKTLTRVNELLAQGAGASEVIPPGLLVAPGIQKKLDDATSTPPAATSTPPVATSTPPQATSTSPTTTSTPPTPSSTLPTMVISPTGICQVRNNYTSVVAFSAPDLGIGYAKLPKPGVNSVEGLRSVCTQSDYNALLETYCTSNSIPVQQEVVTYSSQGQWLSTGGGPFGSNPVSCFVSTPTGSSPTISPTPATNPTPPTTPTPATTSSTATSTSADVTPSPFPTSTSTDIITPPPSETSPPPPSPPTPTPSLSGTDGTWCYDSDQAPPGEGGLWSARIKGHCQDSSGNTYNDYCSNSTTIRDWYCTGTWSGGTWNNVKCDDGGYSGYGSCVDGVLLSSATPIQSAGRLYSISSDAMRDVAIISQVAGSLQLIIEKLSKILQQF